MPRAEQPVARLGWVLDGEFAWEPHKGPARLAADELVGVLRGLQRVEPIDEATAKAAQLLGEAVDADPTNAALWGQFRAALADLRGVGVGDDGDTFAELLASLSAPISDPPVEESSDARAAGRQGGVAVESAVHGASAAGRGRGRGVTG